MLAIKELLPIGTIVHVEGGDKKMMIIGVRPMDQNQGEHDYIVVPYPEGYMGDQSMYLLDDEAITQTVYGGYETEERQEFLEKLDVYYQEQEKSGNL